MASGLTRNQMPGNRLRVRLPCPPLAQNQSSQVIDLASLAMTDLIDAVN